MNIVKSLFGVALQPTPFQGFPSSQVVRRQVESLAERALELKDAGVRRVAAGAGRPGGIGAVDAAIDDDAVAPMTNPEEEALWKVVSSVAAGSDWSEREKFNIARVWPVPLVSRWGCCVFIDNLGVLAACAAYVLGRCVAAMRR